MNYEDYIKPELLVLIPVCYLLGAFIKETEKIKNKYIPLVLGVFAVLMAAVFVAATEGFSLMGIFTSITQGILVAGSAVYVNQLIKQGGKDE